MFYMEIKHSALNIETLGHIDHGKTTLTSVITHTWTDRHSESIKRNMTIKLGYADAVIYKCAACDGAAAYSTQERCHNCGATAEPLMRISILDSPGHETLMATAIAGSAVIDAILFVISADEPCPMQQTREHLMIINVLGIKKVIIAQNKIDIVGKEAALEHYQQIKQFIKGSIIEDAPIIPIMANHSINVDVLLEKIAGMERPVRNTEADPLMYIVRSFDVNKPGIDASSLTGGVIGGAVIRGRLRQGDTVEIRPGIKIGEGERRADAYEPITTTILGISNGSEALDEALPGGLMGIATDLDPAFTKTDGLVGNVVGKPGKLPPVVTSLSMKYHDLNRQDMQKRAVANNEPLLLGIGTATAIGYVKKARKNTIQVELKRPACVEKKTKIAVMRNMAQRWRLAGYGIVE